MCVVSAISGYGQKLPDNFWNHTRWREFGNLLDHAEKVDRDLSQPDCVDPEKEAWRLRIEQRLKLLEAQGQSA